MIMRAGVVPTDENVWGTLRGASTESPAWRANLCSPTWEEMRVLHDEQAACCFAGGYLEKNGAEPQGVGIGGTVLAGEDHVQRAWGRHCGSLGMRPGEEKIPGSRRSDYSLEERTPFHCAP